MDLEQTPGCKSAHLRTFSVQGDKNRTLLTSRGRRKGKERAISSTGKWVTAHKEVLRLSVDYTIITAVAFTAYTIKIQGRSIRYILER